MNDQLETNKRLVREFYELAFNHQQPEEAVRRYLGSYYRQHNPQAPDGAEAFTQFVGSFVGQFPQLNINIKRMIAEDNFVVLHSLLKVSPEDRGTAVVDIFRLEAGKIVEHWDVLQPMPETAANDNTMF